MSGVAKCRKRAHEILAQAERDSRHRQKLITAAEGWLAFANCLRRLENSLQHTRPLAKEAASVDDIFYADLRLRKVQYQSMSQSGWYQNKAAECNSMALASANAVTRGRHIKDRDNWREIAARINAADEAVKQKKEKNK